MTMVMPFLIIAATLLFGAVAWLLSRRSRPLPSLPQISAGIGDSMRAAQPKRFSPKKTLFLIGPSANHPACRLQRKLLKPALSPLMSGGVVVIELYGDDPARKNGAPIEWLDPALLRHAMDAEEGFLIAYVDAEGQTAFRYRAPMLTGDLLVEIGLREEPKRTDGRRFSRQDSAVLNRLRAI